MNMRRAYEMRARAESAEATRQRILEATADLLWQRRPSRVRLEDIATVAGVTVQTVLRIFASKSALVEFAWDTLRDRIMAQREAPQPGDIDGTIAALYQHYETMGDFVVRNLAEEQELPELREGLQQGRHEHRRSMERQFAPQLGKVPEADRALVIDGLVAACDVYTWKLLRRDLGRSRQDAEACVRHMVAALLGGA